MRDCMFKHSSKLALLVVLGAGVVGCADKTNQGASSKSNSVEGPKTYTGSDNPNFVDNSSIQIRSSSCGGVPETKEIGDVSKIQDRVRTRLAEGIESTLFTSDLLSPKFATYGATRGAEPGWPRRIDNGLYIAHLVVRDLKPVLASTVPADIQSFCPSGEIYGGYMAGYSTLSYTFSGHSEAMFLPILTGAFPYGLLICDRGEDLSLKLVKTNHQVFKGETLPDCGNSQVFEAMAKRGE